MVVVDARYAFSNFVEGGKSSAFIEAIEALRDEESFRDFDSADLTELAAIETKRYRSSDIDQLEILLASRGIEARDIRLQLVQYIFVLDRLATAGEGWPGHYFNATTAGPCRAATFKKWFEDRANKTDCTTIALEAKRLRVPGRTDELDYDLEFERLPVLDALLNFLLACPDDIREACRQVFDDLVDGDHTYSRAQRAANALARILDPYFDGVLRRRSELERFKSVVGFLDRLGPERALVFDDENLLAFWQTASLDTKSFGDFVKYETAMRTFLEILDALRGAEYLQSRRVGTKSLGSDFEQGEVDPVAERDAHEAGIAQGGWPLYVDLVEEFRDPLEAFKPGGEAVPTKLLNPTECERVQLLVEMKHHRGEFIRSLLRAEVMGRIQNQIVQAKRNHQATRIQELISLAILDEETEARAKKASKKRPAHLGYDGYSEQYWIYAALAEQLRSRLAACYHVARHWQPNQHDATAFVDDDELGERAPELNSRLEAAGRAFEAINRQGMREALDDRGMGHRVIEAIEPLSRIVSALEGALQELDQMASTIDFESALKIDRVRFAQTFAELEGQ